MAEENQMSVMQKRLEEFDGEIFYLMKDVGRMWANEKASKAQVWQTVLDS